MGSGVDLDVYEIPPNIGLGRGLEGDRHQSTCDTLLGEIESNPESWRDLCSSNLLTPCIMAPIPAPAANKALIAPIILAV
jgi:hypothetical protein